MSMDVIHILHECLFARECHVSGVFYQESAHVIGKESTSILCGFFRNNVQHVSR